MPTDHFAARHRLVLIYKFLVACWHARAGTHLLDSGRSERTTQECCSRSDGNMLLLSTHEERSPRRRSLALEGVAGNSGERDVWYIATLHSKVSSERLSSPGKRQDRPVLGIRTRGIIRALMSQPLNEASEIRKTIQGCSDWTDEGKPLKLLSSEASKVKKFQSRHYETLPQRSYPA